MKVLRSFHLLFLSPTGHPRNDIVSNDDKEEIEHPIAQRFLE